MELWVIITIVAAFFQNIRSSLQKFLKGQLSTTGATFVRFLFGLPFAYLYLVIFFNQSGDEFPIIGEGFFFWASIASLAQIIATVCLLMTFSYRNFAVGTAYSRTEPAQTALFALILFGEQLGIGGILAIAVSITGVLLISVARTDITARTIATSIASPAALYGLASGTLFGLAAVGFRSASLAVEHDLAFMQGVTTLCFAITIQTMMMLGWLLVKERDQFRKILTAWKPALAVGFAGATASFGWFTAFALQQAALVKVVAQIEMLFTFATAIFIFKEQINRKEVIGCLLITAGIMLLFLLG